LTTNTYDQLLSYVVFADWLFFGLTAAGLLIVRRRDPSPRGDIAFVPGHPVTTSLFVLVAAGVVVNSFVAYPTQSLIGATILGVAAAVFFITTRLRP
jgi:APA family basic amino acid/polyamine antiporter